MRQLLLALLPVGLTLPAMAQTRVRPVGEFQGAGKGTRYLVKFEARSSGELVLEASESVAPSFHSSAHCVVAADSVSAWADSASAIVRQKVSPPHAPEKIEFDGPEIPYASCIVKVNRTVTVSGSEYALLIIDRPPMPPTSVIAIVTQSEALAFVAKVRDAATVVLAMTPRAPAAGSALPEATSADTSPPSTGGDQPYFEFQVEKQAAPYADNPRPSYPDMLKSANVQGEVLAQFVVDVNGRVEMNTFKVLKSTHDLFTSSVKAALSSWRFYPAEVGGRRVKQLVQMPFVFGLGGEVELRKYDQRVSINGIDFPYPGYLENIDRQIALRFKTSSSRNLRAEVFFIINRDGTVPPSSIRLVTRSGVYSFDADAQSAVESAANVRVFGALPSGFSEESLLVTFRFDSRLTNSSTTATAPSTSANYPPHPIELFLPPLPVPDRVRGFHMVAEFDVDETGRIVDFNFSPTPDITYNKKIEEVLGKLRFRPGTTADGMPVRMKTKYNFSF